MKKILVIGQTSMMIAQHIYGADYEYCVLTETFNKVPKEDKNKYHGLVSNNSLCMVPNQFVIPSLEAWKKCLIGNSQMHVFVPSLEWAANELIYEESPNPLLQSHLWGSQEAGSMEGFYMSGFTMVRLRAVAEAAGLQVLSAANGKYEREVDGEPFSADNNYIRAIRKKKNAKKI